MLLFDAHLDLAMNAMEWNRDLSRPVQELRERERGLTDKPDRGNSTVSFSEMRRAGIGLCIATQIARFVKPNNPLRGWHSPAQAWAHTQCQLAWYRAMEECGELVKVTDCQELDSHLKLCENSFANIASGTRGDETSPVGIGSAGRLPTGYILSLEGADSLITLKYLERAFAQGLRAVGPAHYGPGTYAHGTDASGGIGSRGKELLKEMDRLGIILDVTHLCDQSFWEAVEVFKGTLWASHSNCRALVPHHRQLSDEQIKYLVQRGAVIGCALDAWMLMPGWVRHETTPERVGLKLERLLEHIDHVCQIAGTARHSGIGSDLDGGFGREQTPYDFDTIADLARLEGMLEQRGYSQEDIALILHGNFIRLLREAWGG